MFLRELFLLAAEQQIIHLCGVDGALPAASEFPISAARGRACRLAHQHPRAAVEHGADPGVEAIAVFGVIISEAQPARVLNTIIQLTDNHFIQAPQ